MDAEKALAWIEQHTRLHTQIEILYVVDGFEVSKTYDGMVMTNCGQFHGETILEAIDKASKVIK